MKKTALLQRWQHVFHWLMIQCVPWECLGCWGGLPPIDLMNKNVGILENFENTKGKTHQKQEAPQKWYSVRLFFLFFSIIYAILAYFKNNYMKHPRRHRHRQGSIKGHFAFSQQALQWVQRFQCHFARRKNARTVGLEKQRGDLWRRCFWLRFKSGWMVARWGLLGSDGKIWVAVDPGYWLFFFWGGSTTQIYEGKFQQAIRILFLKQDFWEMITRILFQACSFELIIKLGEKTTEQLDRHPEWGVQPTK